MTVAQADPVLGVVLMCHAHLDMAARMARIWTEGGARVMVHVDARADDAAFEAMRTGLADHPAIRFSPRRACHWGRFDLVQATRDAAEALLDQEPDVSHVLLASGACLPLRPVAELTAYLGKDPEADFIESVAVEDVFWAIGGLNKERFTRYFPFDWRHRRKLFDAALICQRRLGISRRLPKGLQPHLGSQWWCLTRQTLGAILSDPRRAEYDRYFRLSWIPDESYFQTLARQHSRRLESRSLTLSRFDHQGRPYLLYDDHLDLLQQSGCFVARKVWSGAGQLLQHFPRPSPSSQTDREPDPSRIEQLMNDATARRRHGRPGLYMQSRFPRRNLEYGKTPGRYVVLQGFAELIPGFEDWLASRVDADIHGHLFSPDGAEFAGRDAYGPGALSTSPALRDHDPQRFLCSLLRMTDRMQVFQHGPGDGPQINAFMVSDPNARMLVICGAWLVPLFFSDLPFQQIRQVAAEMQRAEVKQFRMLTSSWRHARITTWSLAQAAADPAQVVSAALTQMGAGGTLPSDLPPLRDLSGFGSFLQRLRNAGLRPELTGYFPPTDPVITQGPPA